MWIQFLLIAAFVVVAVVEVRQGGGGARHLAIRRLLLVGLVAFAVFSVLFPEWLSWVAERLGVGRGTDLVLYALVVAFISYVVTTHRRMVALDRKITVLARRLALEEARLSADEAAGARSDPEG